MWHIIVNPVAGNGLALRAFARVRERLEQLGQQFQTHQTKAPNHATQIAAELAQAGVDKVLCIGGDGTLYEVANGLRGTNTAMAIIPAGTGNDFCRTLNISRDPLKALDIALAGNARRVDVGMLGQRSFLNVAGLGFDVRVLKKMTKYKRLGHGQLPYLLAVIETILTYRPWDIHLEMDGQDIRCRMLMVCIANGRYFGGGMQVAPQADPYDGLLDIVVIEHVSRWRIPFLLPKFISGRCDAFKEVRRYSARKLRLPGQTAEYNLDGEIITVENAEFTVQHGGVAILIMCGE